jgi:hypothetical protein
MRPTAPSGIPARANDRCLRLADPGREINRDRTYARGGVALGPIRYMTRAGAARSNWSSQREGASLDRYLQAGSLRPPMALALERLGVQPSSRLRFARRTRPQSFMSSTGRPEPATRGARLPDACVVRVSDHRPGVQRSASSTTAAISGEPSSRARSLWSAVLDFDEAHRTARSASHRAALVGRHDPVVRPVDDRRRHRQERELLGQWVTVLEQGPDWERVCIWPPDARSTNGERSTSPAGGCADARSVTTAAPRLSP